MLCLFSQRNKREIVQAVVDPKVFAVRTLLLTVRQPNPMHVAEHNPVLLRFRTLDNAVPCVTK